MQTDFNVNKKTRSILDWNKFNAHSCANNECATEKYVARSVGRRARSSWMASEKYFVYSKNLLEENTKYRVCTVGDDKALQGNRAVTFT